MGCGRADRDRIAGDVIGHPVDPADIHQIRGRRQPLLHGRDQRLTPGQNLAVLGDLSKPPPHPSIEEGL